MKSKQPKQKSNWWNIDETGALAIGSSLLLGVIWWGAFTLYEYNLLTKKEQRQEQLEASGAKAMELCRAWSKGQSTYINKPGLRLYSQIDSEDNAIPGKNIWMRDPDEFPEEVPLADCFANYSENDFVEVKGVIVGNKYTSEAWPCHRGYKLNSSYDSNNKNDRKYLSCLFDPDLETVSSSGSHVYEIKEIWRFDLDGNQIR